MAISFKEGDRVVCATTHKNSRRKTIQKGDKGIVQETNSNPYIIWDKTHEDSYYSDDIGGGKPMECCFEKYLVLVPETTETPYTKLHPKVGDKFRVIKNLNSNWKKYFSKGAIVKVTSIQRWQSSEQPDDFRWYMSESDLTTEYLEPIKDELRTINTKDKSKFVTGGIGHWHIDAGATISNGNIETLAGYKFYRTTEPIIKPNTITKMTNFIKNALLSADDKALIKANYLNNDLSLTSDGKQALEFIAFTEHKKALVTMAKEAIAEAKANCD